MLQVEMSASVRTASGKGPMRQLRMQGFTPAVVYGAGAEAQKLQCDTKDLTAKLIKYARKNTIVTLKIDNGVEKDVVVGEIQTDPVKDTLIHVDFLEIDLKQERSFNVPVKYQGKAKGVDLGGILVVGCDTVVLKGKPLDIPEEIVISVSGLLIGDKIKCRHIELPENVEMVTEGRTVAVSVVTPGAKVSDDDEEEETVAEGSEGEASEE
ncbi:50S ribosomal protein L25 [Desulforhopalus singaporensis]|uniref:Large ribosomal subunit protein bL25 n=1 Tax=Desulforhopalus singaporensis TaxID=91360 RepID=A0A1H0MT06_9BACT|nr:50S ribosomal protein L25 [Desulforhopalus singaporensis]SDO83435.1 large subunit ribosomal protein L25 [Desulforhopalus singaporensis]